MIFYYGKIAPGAIQNISPVVTTTTGRADFELLDNGSLKFVHYPDCQQLIIWLPRPGVEYSKVILRNTDTGSVQEEWPVADKLSGTVQLLWDTLPVPPGNYTIEINLQNSGQHIIGIRKYKEGEEMPQENEPINEPYSDKPIVYRDGFGNIIPDEDLIMRSKVLKEMEDKFARRIEYTGEGRSGHLTYLEGEYCLKFYYEFGGGDCIAWIAIPLPEQWEQQTGMSVERREDVIGFIADTVKLQRVPNSRVDISASAISYFYK